MIRNDSIKLITNVLSDEASLPGTAHDKQPALPKATKQRSKLVVTKLPAVSPRSLAKFSPAIRKQVARAASNISEILIKNPE